MPLIEVQFVSKSYGKLKAVDNLSFSAEPGEVFGLLGPNGAGKTTTMEMMEGLRRPDSGDIFIGGKDIRRDLQQIKEIIGVQLQSTSLYNKIRVVEALKLYGGYYQRSQPVEALLELVELTEKRNSFHKELSGGQQQRLALALTLINDPLVIFLDEPTTGLDPQARRMLWEIIGRMKSAEKTVLLTTHYMEEAERLCDRIAIMDHGKIIAQGTPRELISRLEIDSCIEFSRNIALKQDDLRQLPAVRKVLSNGENTELLSAATQETLVALVEFAGRQQTTISELHVRRPTLEDLFIELTGRSLRE